MKFNLEAITLKMDALSKIRRQGFGLMACCERQSAHSRLLGMPCGLDRDTIDVPIVLLCILAHLLGYYEENYLLCTVSQNFMERVVVVVWPRRFHRLGRFNFQPFDSGTKI